MVKVRIMEGAPVSQDMKSYSWPDKEASLNKHFRIFRKMKDSSEVWVRGDGYGEFGRGAYGNGCIKVDRKYLVDV
jgi:hypothetical protein